MTEYNQEVLSELHKNHQHWLNEARNLGAGNFAEDIVQEMYLKIAYYVDDVQRIMYKDKGVNTFYVYITMRNLVYDLKRAKSRFKIISLETAKNELKALPHDEYDYDDDADFENKMRFISEEIKNWHWYDQKLWELYYNSELSIRKLSSETKISTSSIFNTLKNGRERIKKGYEN